MRIVLNCSWILLLGLLVSCGGREFKKSPIDVLIRDMDKEPTFSIVLHDMDVQGNFSKSYMHKYKIIKEKDSVPYEEYTDWMEVKEDFFWKNENNMGMELASKGEDGKISKVAQPAGYGRYVGNPRYGRWERGSNGESFWSFYGKYAMMRSLFNLGSRSIYRRDYRDFTTNYRGRKPYYGGSSSKPMFGTNSSHTKSSRPDFFERRQQKQGFKRSSSSRRSRSSSRYNSRSSYRSRGGGFGK